jgi:ATP-dependent Clp protease ATP-binding subunit ClpB
MNRFQKIGFSTGAEASSFVDVKDKITDSLKNHFRPEFLNRLDEIIIFEPLSAEVIKEIVKIQLAVVEKRLAERGIMLDVAGAVLDYLAREGYKPEYGARPLKRLIQTKVLNPVAELIIARQIENGGVVGVSLKDGLPVVEMQRGFKTRLSSGRLKQKKV